VFAAYYPERVRKLVIANAPHPAIFERELSDNPKQQSASSYFDLFARPEAEQMLIANEFAFLTRATLEEGLRSGYRTEEDRQKYIEAWSQPGAIHAGLNYYRVNRLRLPSTSDGHWSIRDAMPELDSTTVKMPTLVLWGLQDRALLPDNLEGLEQFVPNLSIKTYSDTGHWVISAKAVEVNRLVRDFFQR
jgi:epoxide hydrolase 4